MLTAQQKQLLQEAIEKMQEADALMQEALGDTDVCFETHCGIQSLIDDLRDDIEGILE